MVITTKLKQRFCTDCNIPINIFVEPYFTDRLQLYDEFYGTLDKWKVFVTELEKYHSEQEYFDEYNRVKDDAINFIKGTEAYQQFIEEDMNEYYTIHKNLPGKDIYHPDNDGKTFISIDMKKANFSALNFYNASIFNYSDTWEEFIGKFTNNQHIINSKYIRQVILGNCNPKRHITLEKYLMDMVLSTLSQRICCDLNKVVFFSNDEIVFDVTDMAGFEQRLFLSSINEKIECIKIPLKVELFKLVKIKGTDGYCKKFSFDENKIEFKSLNSLYIPFVLRYFNHEEITESDKVFYHNGLLAQLVETPCISML